jgi:hypothetical protein
MRKIRVTGFSLTPAVLGIALVSTVSEISVNANGCE